MTIKEIAKRAKELKYVPSECRGSIKALETYADHVGLSKLQIVSEALKSFSRYADHPKAPPDLKKLGMVCREKAENIDALILEFFE